MLPVLRALCLVAIVLAIGTARADGDTSGGKDTVALLPLDAPPRLEAFGQPIAAEISRVLVGDKLDVVVVGKAMSPPTAKLIVDGSMTSAGDQVILKLRIRNGKDGTTMKDNIVETAKNLVGITEASTKLAAKLLPIIREKLDEIHKDEKAHSVDPRPPVRQPVQSQDPILLVGIGVPPGASTLINPLRLALTDEVGSWARRSKRAPASVDASVLGRQLATQTVATAGAERGIVFEILDYDIIPLAIPLATARVRVRIADRSSVVFDRVIATDSVVGDRKMTGDQLADRVAREVLTILRPHMKRLEPTWR